MSLPTPILICGAGPVGLSLALRLAQQGVEVIVFEALPELNPQTRASTFHPPTLEMFDAWGLWHDIQREAEIVRELYYYRRDPLELVAAFHFGLIDRFTTHPYRIHYPQHRLTTLLYQQLEAVRPNSLRFNHRLQSFTDTGDHVIATFKTPDGPVTYEGGLLCAADGFHSAVRQQLDVSFSGKTIDDRFLIIDTVANLGLQLPTVAPVMYVFDPEEWVIVQQFKTSVRFTFRIAPEEDAELLRERKLVYSRIDHFFPRLSHNVQRTAVYAVNQRVADTFHVGRVALMGDAAHVTNPIGGMGLNSGIHDAAFLADLLANPTLTDYNSALEIYNQTRREVALRSVNPSAEIDYADMTAASHHDIAARDDRFATLAADLTLARDFLLRASMLADRIPGD